MSWGRTRRTVRGATPNNARGSRRRRLEGGSGAEAGGDVHGAQPEPSRGGQLRRRRDGPVEADEATRGAAGSSVSQRKVMGLLIHGDAAFCGLGVNAEVMQLQDLPDYTTGGTVHIVVNNQTRGSPRCRGARDRARTRATSPRGTGLRFFTSTATTPRRVVRACRLCRADFRAEWGQDVVINLVCYRRLGHNEQDDPSITLPLLSNGSSGSARVGDLRRSARRRRRGDEGRGGPMDRTVRRRVPSRARRGGDVRGITRGLGGVDVHGPTRQRVERGRAVAAGEGAAAGAGREQNAGGGGRHRRGRAGRAPRGVSGGIVER